MRRPVVPARRAAAVAAVVLVAAAGWWLLRAPALERPAAAAPPEPDLDPPAMRARREAALALAAMPDDPWTFAESLAASAPAAASAASRCGVDQRPKMSKAAGEGEDADGDPAAQPAGPAYLAERSRVDAVLRASDDAFDNAVADWVDIGGEPASPQRLEALAQRAMTSGDPRVYSLAYRACHASDWRLGTAQAPELEGGGCAMLSARRWSELDPGNAVPWMYVFSQATAAGDRTAQQEALVRMASSGRFEDRLHDAAGAIVSHASRDDDALAADLDLSEAAFQKAVAQDESFNLLMAACKDKAAGDANRAQQCAAIGELMFAHGDNLLLQAMGSVLVLRATGDSSRRDQARAEREAMSRTWSPGTGLSDCGMVRDGLKAMRRNAQVGELAAARERVHEGVAP